MQRERTHTDDSDNSGGQSNREPASAASSGACLGSRLCAATLCCIVLQYAMTPQSYAAVRRSLAPSQWTSLCDNAPT